MAHRVVFVLILLVTAAGAPSVRPAAAQAPSTGEWTISGGGVDRGVRFGSGGLRTFRLALKSTTTDVLAAAVEHDEYGAEFSFDVDGVPVSGNSPAFELVDASTADAPRNGSVTIVRLRHRSVPVDVAVHYATYGGHPATRKWLAITNRGTRPLVLTRLVVESLLVSPGTPADVQVSGYYGLAPRESFFTGRVDDALVVVRNGRTSESLAVLNEAPGYMKRTDIGGWDRSWAVGIRAGADTDLFPFERRVAPGETYTTAPVSLVLYDDGKEGMGGRKVIPPYVAAVIAHKYPAGPAPWIYNTWEPFERKIDKATVRQLVESAGRMGFDIFTIDDGWQKEYGANVVDERAFPGGLDDIRQEIEAKHMRLGLWVPVAAIDRSTDAYRQHPEWACRDAMGQPKTTGAMAGSKVVMCLATPYRKVAAARIRDLIRQFHLAYVKLDLTTIFNTYGEAPGCHATGHEHATWAESLGRTYEGLADLTKEVYAEFPDVKIDLTFEVWGQKHTIDYGLVAAGDLDWLSNVDDSSAGAAGPRQARTLLYHRSLAMPAETMLVGNLQAQTEPVEERFATAIGSVPLLLGDLRAVPVARQSWYAEKIAWFKGVRDAVNLNGQFVPLGGWRQPGPAEWDGFARLSPAGEGIVVVFRNEAQVADASVRLPVAETRKFQVRSAMTGREMGVVTGAELRRGFRVVLPRTGAVEILELRTAVPTLPTLLPEPPGGDR